MGEEYNREVYGRDLLILNQQQAGHEIFYDLNKMKAKQNI